MCYIGCLLSVGLFGSVFSFAIRMYCEGVRPVAFLNALKKVVGERKPTCSEIAFSVRVSALPSSSISLTFCILLRFSSSRKEVPPIWFIASDTYFVLEPKALARLPIEKSGSRKPSEEFRNSTIRLYRITADSCLAFSVFGHGADVFPMASSRLLFSMSVNSWLRLNNSR